MVQAEWRDLVVLIIFTRFLDCRPDGLLLGMTGEGFAPGKPILKTSFILHIDIVVSDV